MKFSEDHSETVFSIAQNPRILQLAIEITFLMAAVYRRLLEQMGIWKPLGGPFAVAFIESEEEPLS
jgi:hypothetical protein